MAIYDVSYKVRGNLAEITPLAWKWDWRTVRGIVATSEEQARAKAVIQFRLDGYTVDLREWIISNREEVKSNGEAEG